MATLTKTNTLTNGTNADAGEVDTNFDDVIAWINTNVIQIDGGAFTTLPTSAVTPTTDTQLVTKTYVDSEVAFTWGTFTPGTYGITVGNGSQVAEYVEIGGTTFWRYKFELGSTSAVTGEVRIDMPTTMADASMGSFGHVLYEDDDSADYAGNLFRLNSLTTRLRVADCSVTYPRLVDLSGTIPFLWSTDDIMAAHGWYKTS